MRINVLKYIQLAELPKLYCKKRICKATDKKCPTSSAGKCDDTLTTEPCIDKKTISDELERRYSLCRLLVILALSILAWGLVVKHLLVWFPNLKATDMPLVGSILLVIILSPAIYSFFYRPLIMQFDDLKRAEVKMRELALIDVLTGLYNRRGFLTYTEHLLKLSNRTQRGLILIYADLDNMKQINDTLGHEQGDRALVSTAEVLKKTFRHSDVIARVGGDEFAILALEAKAESLDALRKRLNENLRKTAYNTDSMQKLTFSLGIIYYNPEKPHTIEELLKRADALMYEEKRLEEDPARRDIPPGNKG